MLLGVFCFVAAATAAPAPIVAVVDAYHAAMEARSVEKLAAVFDPGLVVLEGTHENTGWPDYRDNHIGPEMKEWSAFKILETRITDWVDGGELAYVVTQSRYRITSKGKPVTIAAAETLVLRLTAGQWRIRHVHSSGKKVDP